MARVGIRKSTLEMRIAYVYLNMGKNADEEFIVGQCTVLHSTLLTGIGRRQTLCVCVGGWGFDPFLPPAPL